MTMTATSAEITADTSADIAITFADGLVGCQDWKQFVLVTDDSDADLPVAILQSLDNPEISLLVTDPRFVDPEFSPQLSAEDLSDLGMSSDAEPVVYCTLSAVEGLITANLMGPLVVNPTNRRAKQVVQIESAYTTRYPVASLAAAGA
jgi:flagellar assembly factor FliW